MDLADLLQQQLSGNDLTGISQQIGADERTTSQAASIAIPLLISALARNSSKPEGAQALFNAVERDHDGSILSDVPGYLGDPQAANGAGILKHVLGNRTQSVESGIAQSSGLDAASVAQLLQILAPLVMGAVGQTQRQQRLDTRGLSDYLGGQEQAMERQSPDMISTLGNLLDMDGDGTALDDLGRIAGDLFGNR